MKDEENYQYPGEEYSTAPSAVIEETPEKLKKPSFEKIGIFVQNYKRPIIVITTIIVALIIFKIMNHQRQNEVMDVTPVKEKPVVENITFNKLEKIITEVNALKRAENSNDESMRDLQNQIQQMNATLAEVNQNNLIVMEEIKKLNEKLNNSPAPATRKKIKHTIIFKVTAMVPGRAWIKNNHGLTESVKIGDAVPDYGTITEIDAEHGVITTSSNRTIRYGSNDE